MGRYGEPRTLYSGRSYRELYGDIGRYREIKGDVGRYGAAKTLYSGSRVSVSSATLMPLYRPRSAPPG